MKPLNILCADDSASFRALLEAVLKGDGHRVTMVASGEEAVEHFRREVPDMVLIDRVMPGIGGVKAVQTIRSLHADTRVPILMITTSMADEDVLDAFMAGVDEFILKPLQPLHLKIRLQSVMRTVAAERSMAAIIEKLCEGVIRIDLRGTITLFNAMAEKIFGYAEEEVIGRHFEMLFDATDREACNDRLGRFLASGDTALIEGGRRMMGLRKGRETFPMFFGMAEAGTPDGLALVCLARDLTEEERLMRQVERLALHDSLTGLPNRLQCMQYLDLRYAATGGPAHCTAFYFDLDGFKQINDTLGHAAGDLALSTTASRVREALFVRDFFARLGGDEFVVVVDGQLDDTEALAIGQRLIRAVSPPIQSEYGPMQLGASVGFAHAGNHRGSVDELLSAADAAMFAAKRAGKGRVCAAP